MQFRVQRYCFFLTFANNKNKISEIFVFCLEKFAHLGFLLYLCSRFPTKGTALVKAWGDPIIFLADMAW